MIPAKLISCLPLSLQQTVIEIDEPLMLGQNTHQSRLHKNLGAAGWAKIIKMVKPIFHGPDE